MNKKIIVSLEEIENLIKHSQDSGKIKNAIKSLRANVGAALVVAQNVVGQNKGQAQGLPLQELDKELEIWESKLSVILNEPIGRQGMAKHAAHWIERLKK